MNNINLQQLKQAELAKTHQALFSRFSQGVDPDKAGEILGYAPDAVIDLVKKMQQLSGAEGAGLNGSELDSVELNKLAKIEKENEDQLISRARPLAIQTLLNVIQTSENDTARVRAAMGILALDGGSADDSSVSKLKAMIKQMKESVKAQEASTIIDLTIDSQTNKTTEEIISIGDNPLNKECLAGAV
jgi:hypothetical protein